MTVHLVDEGLDTGRTGAGSRRRRAARHARGADPRRRAPPAAGDRPPNSCNKLLPRRSARMRALISVWDKNGIADFARGLVAVGFELVSSGGTADFLSDAGLEVTRVEEVTAAPEMLGGGASRRCTRASTPASSRGATCRRTSTRSPSTGSSPSTSSASTSIRSPRSRRAPVSPEEEAVEMIDVGGPSMLRAAAKNFAHVAVVCRPEQYEPVLEELRARGELSLELRRSLANEAFATTAAYDAAIARWFGETEAFPEQLTIALQKVADLPYGENPHQRAAYYRELGARRHLLSNVDQLGGRELVQQPRRPRGGDPAREAARPARGRARQAHEPVWGRRGGDDRGGLRARARSRPGLGIRLRARPEPPGLRRARAPDRRAVRRGAAGAGVRRRMRSRRCARRRR